MDDNLLGQSISNVLSSPESSINMCVNIFLFYGEFIEKGGG